jgi:hypothetical protein
MPFGPKIFGLFADYGMFENGLSSKVYTAFNAGIGMRLGKVFGLYFPVYMTKEMDAAYGNANYATRIRFTLKLNITNKPLNLSGIL